MARIFRILQKLLEHMNSLKCNNSSECLQNRNIDLQTICFSRVYTEFLNYTITTLENEGNQFFNSPRWSFSSFLTKYSFYIECRKLHLMKRHFQSGRKKTLRVTIFLTVWQLFRPHVDFSDYIMKKFGNLSKMWCFSTIEDNFTLKTCSFKNFPLIPSTYINNYLYHKILLKLPWTILLNDLNRTKVQKTTCRKSNFRFAHIELFSQRNN